MEREKLKSTLAELHSELSSAHSEMDDETKSLLEQLSVDINRIVLTPSSPATEVPDRTEEKQGVLDQLLNLTVEFEDSHPKLAEAIGRVATALSRIGI